MISRMKNRNRGFNVAVQPQMMPVLTSTMDIRNAYPAIQVRSSAVRSTVAMIQRVRAIMNAISPDRKTPETRIFSRYESRNRHTIGIGSIATVKSDAIDIAPHAISGGIKETQVPGSFFWKYFSTGVQLKICKMMLLER